MIEGEADVLEMPRSEVGDGGDHDELGPPPRYGTADLMDRWGVEDYDTIYSIPREELPFTMIGGVRRYRAKDIRAYERRHAEGDWD